MWLDFILIAVLAYRNAMRAALKGQNGVVWAVFTAVAWIVASMLGWMFIIACFYRDLFSASSLAATDFNQMWQQSKKRGEAIAQGMAEHPLQGVTILLFSFGGYLLIRYLIDRRPDKKLPEVHWMDKLGDGNK